MTSRGVMLRVGVALVPVAVAATWCFGWGVVTNLIVALVSGMALEAAWLWLRHRSLAAATDGSAPVTCALIALAVPPGLPAGILVFAVAVALLLAKHLYGGLGRNVFNPAMAGYAAALVAYPAAFGEWDALTGATALDALRYRDGATVAEVWMQDAFGAIGGRGFEMVNAAALVGGVWLCALRVAHWRCPVAVLGSLGLCAALGYDGGSSASLGSPLFHWFAGGTMLAAFFVATDPVTAPAAPVAQWLFGALIGIVIYVIRAFGAWPDGIAFAVLFGNLAAPALDRLCLPR